MSISLLNLHWWEYLFIVLSIFITCVFLNYLVKRMNEAKLEERFARLSHKASTTQSTQVHGGLIEMETNRGLNFKPQNTLEKLSPRGISLVFNQEQNKRRRDLEETFDIIKNTIDSRKLDVLSMQPDASREIVETSPKKRSNCNLNEHKTVKEHDPGRIVKKSSLLEISLKELQESNQIIPAVTKSIEKINEDVVPRSFIVKTVDSLVSKIAGSSNLNDDPLSQQRSSTDIGLRSFVVRTVDSLVLKIAGSSNANDNSQIQQKPDWNKELLVPQVPSKEDLKASKSSSKSNNNDSK